MVVSVILVGVEYPVNLGMIARICENFGVAELVLVAPVAKKDDPQAVMYSKQALPTLQNAKVVGSLEEIQNDYELFVAMSGILNRHKNTFRTFYTMQEFAKKMPGGRIALVFGREGIGLTEKEIDFCDFVVNIPTSNKYPILNLANAVAIALYATSRISRARKKSIDPLQKNTLYKSFDYFVDRLSAKNEFRNPKKIKIAFKRLMSMSMFPEKETKSIIAVFKRIEDELRKMNYSAPIK